jgi:hypothetical protein
VTWLSARRGLTCALAGLTLTTPSARIFTIVDNNFADSWYFSRFTGTLSFTFAGH